MQAKRKSNVNNRSDSNLKKESTKNNGLQIMDTESEIGTTGPYVPAMCRTQTPNTNIGLKVGGAAPTFTNKKSSNGETTTTFNRTETPISNLDIAPDQTDQMRKIDIPH